MERSQMHWTERELKSFNTLSLGGALGNCELYCNQPQGGDRDFQASLRSSIHHLHDEPFQKNVSKKMVESCDDQRE